ncbi:MAG: succinylglutamate desuccinylase/aspartoacylase family protein [Haloferacaceae archaeon]
MRTYQLGEGTPEVAVVGGIHGDEPCGARAVERIAADAPSVERPVRLIVANEAALDRGERYVDVDLNRSFDDDVPPDAHEYGLAERLASALADCTVLSIHSTRSHPEPFGIVNGLDGPVGDIAPKLSVTALVDIDDEEGRLFALEATDLIEVEAGRQGTDAAAENAYRLAREFLTATGALPGRTASRDVPVYRLDDRIEKPRAERYEVLVENFVRVDAGEPFAVADGDRLVAEDPFVPVLLSARGYDDIFGYAGDRVGTLEGDGADAD